MVNAPKISVVMGCYNQLSVLQRVLAAYEHQTLNPDLFEVIVVNSSSPDGTAEWAQTYHPNFQFRHLLVPNRGKAAARNTGVSQARGQWIIITDADMIPDPQFLAAHLAAQEATTRPTCFEGLAWNLPTLEWPPTPATLKPQVGTHPADRAKLGWYYFLTGNLSFPKGIFEAFKGFDPTFTGYGWEDLELGYRLQKAKVPILYLRTAINYHFHVIAPDADIVRGEDKGRSAKIMLAKHPELKWFLGLNPLSAAIFPRIAKGGRFYRWVSEKCYHSQNPILHGFGFWFLKEHHYLQGILSDA